MATNREMSEETRRRIVDTFWAMADEEGLGRITVWSLMKRVGMNRSTFYEYFDGIEDLLRRSEDELLAQLSAEATSIIRGGSAEDRYPPNVLARLFPAYIGKAVLLLGANGDPGFFDRMKEVMKPILCEAYGIDPDGDDGDRIIDFIVSLGVGIVTRSSREGLDEEELVGRLLDAQRIAFYGISRYTDTDPFERMDRGGTGPPRGFVRPPGATSCGRHTIRPRSRRGRSPGSARSPTGTSSRPRTCRWSSASRRPSGRRS